MDVRRSAGWVRRWVDLYTRGLPADVRRDRVDEIGDDLWSQLHDATGSARSQVATSREIVLRLVLGIPADISWRLEQRRATASGAAPERGPAMYARTISALAMVGGIAWATWVALALLLARDAWVGSMALVVVASLMAGSVALAIALGALVSSNIDRLRGPVALLGAIGAVGALLNAAAVFAGGIVALPIGSSAVMLNLDHLGLVGRWRARSHALAGIASTIPAAVLLVNRGDVPSALPYLALLVSVVAYALTWILVGWSLRAGAWIPDAPEVPV